MFNIKINDLLKIADGTLLCGNIDDEILNCSVNSKKLVNCDTFFGLKGNNMDGSIFYEEAIKNNIRTCVLNKNIKIKKEYYNKCNIVLVDDVYDTLKQLAIYKRGLFKGKVIGITGSVGKTTTKEMISNILSKKYKVLKTYKNENSKIGVLLTILRLKDEDIMVIEMGISYPNEMDFLSQIVKPDISVITNIFSSHIENFKDEKELFKEKFKITKFMKKGFLVINNDNIKNFNYKINKNINVITYGIKEKSNFTAYNIVEKDNTYFSVGNMKNILIPYLKNFIYNALSSIVVSKIFMFEDNIIKESLKEKINVEHRLQNIELKNNILLIDDSYNASYESIKNAIDYLNKYKRRKILILGSILELGNNSKIIHSNISKILLDKKIDIIILIGYDTKMIKKNLKDKKCIIKYFNNELNSRKYIKRIIKENDVILAKGSNGINLVNIVNFLKYNI